MTAIGKTWAPVLLAAGLWAFAWMYAQLPPPGDAVTAIQMDPPRASSADLAAVDIGRASAREIEKHVEKPASDADTFYVQDNPGLGVGSRRGTDEILNVQPVIQIHLTEDWEPVTRTMPPLAWSPPAIPEPSVLLGPGAATVAVLASPHKPIDGWTSGAGPIVRVPTISGKTPGSDAWGVGPAFVGGRLVGPIVAGSYVNNVSSDGGMSGRGARWGAPGDATGYGLFTTDPGGHYSVGKGWFVRGAPSIAAVELPDGAKWTLPVGAQVGREIKINDGVPVDLLVGIYYDAQQSELGGARWRLRTGVGFIF
ncbi:MAG TPA: hypothetical protein VJK90_01585 [Acetobacteraceae bacterium]|nr:hypothetical protein [Acetobacteraceae bacterium]